MKLHVHVVISHKTMPHPHNQSYSMCTSLLTAVVRVQDTTSPKSFGLQPSGNATNPYVHVHGCNNCGVHVHKIPQHFSKPKALFLNTVYSIVCMLDFFICHIQGAQRVTLFQVL